MRGGAARVHGPAARYLSTLFALCILGWAVPALLMLNRGFAIEDEGTYVLSYRFWSSNPYFVSGSQFLYGPVFEALGESIPALRLLRLVMVVGANAWFARSFLAWLEVQRPGLLPAPRACLSLLLVAAGGMAYLWTPLTPGYYDLTADASLALASLLLLTLVRAPSPPPWVPLLTGVVGVALALTKWTALPVLVLTVGIAFYCLARASRPTALRYAGLVAVGAAVTLVGCQVFVVSLAGYVRTLAKVSSLTAVGSHSMAYLAGRNLDDTLTALAGALLLGLPLLGGLLVARVQARRGSHRAAQAWVIGAAVVSAAVVPFALGWHGGDDRGRVVIDIALAALLTAALAALVPGPRSLPGGVSGRLVAVTLLLVPFAQAAGTNVPVLYVAFECLAMWVALVLMATTRADCPTLTTKVVLADLSALVVLTALICGSTTIATPFKTSGLTDATAGVPPLGVDVTPAVAGQYEALDQALASYVHRGSTPVFAMDQNAGLTYLVGGVPAGSTWNDGASPTRTGGILALACRHGDVRAAPVLLLSRRVDPDVARALDGCGFGYPQGYRRLAVPGGPAHLVVMVPRGG
ncbi:MAG TPA: hypothetical protein VH085_10395 [Nocardioides sp.]|jgi:hypothetical protein|nr:hypothetical protein [Nocardioides sp.]